MGEFEDAMEAYKNSDNWLKFQKASKGKPKKKRSKGKSKGNSKAQPSAPVKPDGMPDKPLDAFKFFCKEHTGKGAGELSQMFRDLSNEERDERLKQAQERFEKYQDDLAKFENSVEGKKYRKECEVFKKRKCLKIAKEQYLKDAPKKPTTAYMIFVSEKRSEVQKDNPEIRGLGPLVAKMSEIWRDMTDEKREVFKVKEQQQ